MREKIGFFVILIVCISIASVVLGGSAQGADSKGIFSWLANAAPTGGFPGLISSWHNAVDLLVFPPRQIGFWSSGSSRLRVRIGRE